ncbi:MAG TPA: N-acetyl-gamma-glutamyl-phosphate reductase [Caulobacteraceae bacterium]|jgi:N-acetyl-gamma-glutamyl-phosphate reductase
MVATVFIDGEAGTTGLRIRQLLAGRPDLEVISVDPAHRKDAEVRRPLLNQADAIILCLPDEAARQAVSLIDNPAVRIIDASTAHRVASGWTYGFAEMAPGQRGAVAAAKRIANPGCYATGFIALVRPLIAAGLVPADWPISANAVSGYSGGGRAMIAEFEDQSSRDYTSAHFRAYALNLGHKHVPEMQVHCGLARAPIFAPAVGRFHSGMIVEVPLAVSAMPARPALADLHGALAAAYASEAFVEVTSLGEGSHIDPEALNGTNRMRLHVFGSARLGQARLIAVLDNLGKGAAGAAVQNLNLALGLAECAGLAEM